MASRGVVALLAAGVPPERFATVLGHELTHLVHRRVFGPNLDPWLSEGLADALGDTATPSGFDGLAGIAGIEPLADRLRRAIEAERTESLAAMIAKSRGEFDRGAVSYDYESSALLTRYLLLEPTMAQRFRDLLRKLAAAKSCSADCVFESLEVTPEQLDREFQEWLAAHAS
ncbi:MAG: hypothetical protein GY769_25735 [bacterium]|nr:hypothetical protein [bacterium]